MVTASSLAVAPGSLATLGLVPAGTSRRGRTRLQRARPGRCPGSSAEAQGGCPSPGAGWHHCLAEEAASPVGWRHQRVVTRRRKGLAQQVHSKSSCCLPPSEALVVAAQVGAESQLQCPQAPALENGCLGSSGLSFPGVWTQQRAASLLGLGAPLWPRLEGGRTVPPGQPQRASSTWTSPHGRLADVASGLPPGRRRGCLQWAPAVHPLLHPFTHTVSKPSPGPPGPALCWAGGIQGWISPGPAQKEWAGGQSVQRGGSYVCSRADQGTLLEGALVNSGLWWVAKGWEEASCLRSSTSLEVARPGCSGNRQ